MLCTLVILEKEVILVIWELLAILVKKVTKVILGKMVQLPTGYTGKQGKQGVTGYTGQDGQVVSKGDKGERSETGSRGKRGYKGEKIIFFTGPGVSY